MSRESFLQRVRAAAHAGRAYRVHIQDFPADTGYVGVDTELCQAMAAEVELVGGAAHLVDDAQQAKSVLGELLGQYQVKSALCWQHETLERIGLCDLLESLEVSLLTHDSLVGLSPHEQRSRMLAADIGISSADRAIAETGTLLVCAKAGQERAASLLPPVHVAIIERRQIVPDLIDALQPFASQSESMPSNISLITGPSKTGDIELQLTTGVHGPGKWHVIIMQSG